MANDDNVTAIEFEENNFNVLDNDEDPDGDTLTIQSYTQSVEGGSVTCEIDGDCTYVDPGGDPPYEDSFTYTVTDGSSSDTATVNITVESSGGGDGDAKRITLRLSGGLVAKGAVESRSVKCTRDEPVNIQVRNEGGWKTFEKTKTNDNGNYRIRIPHRFGRYRAETPLRGLCNRDVSPARSYVTNDPQTIRDGNDVPGFLDIAKVRIDHDGVDMQLTWTAHDPWQLSSLQDGRRLGVYLFYSGGYHSIDIDMGEDLPIVPIVPCNGSPGGGQSCDYGATEYGEGEKAGPKAIDFTLPLRHLDGLAKRFRWQGHSSSTGSGGFDFTAKKRYRR